MGLTGSSSRRTSQPGAQQQQQQQAPLYPPAAATDETWRNRVAEVHALLQQQRQSAAATSAAVANHEFATAIRSLSVAGVATAVAMRGAGLQVVQALVANRIDGLGLAALGPQALQLVQARDEPGRLGLLQMAMIAHNYASATPVKANPFPPRHGDEDGFFEWLHAETSHGADHSSRAAPQARWSSQPTPFRRYYGAPMLLLPELNPEGSGGIGTAVHDVNTQPISTLSMQAIAQLLHLSLATGAGIPGNSGIHYKRVNPSSGCLHPVEAYVVVPPVNSDPPGPAALLHYAPKEGGVEVRAQLPARVWGSLMGSLAPDCSANSCFLVALTAIPWREMWKYGERGLRYTELDVGHAMTAIHIAARTLGWHLQVIPHVCSSGLAKLLGLPQTPAESSDTTTCSHVDIEQEIPMLLAIVHTHAGTPAAAVSSSALCVALADMDTDPSRWFGAPNPIGYGHMHWPLVQTAVRKLWHECKLCSPTAAEHVLPEPSSTSSPETKAEPEECEGCRQPAVKIIQQRRSAYEFRPFSIPRNLFLHAFVRSMKASAPMLAQLSKQARLGVILFVLRVEDLPSGIYVCDFDDTGDVETSMFGPAVEPDTKFELVTDAYGLKQLQIIPLEQLSKSAVDRVSCGQSFVGQYEPACQMGVIAHVRHRGVMVASFYGIHAAADGSSYRAAHQLAGAAGHLVYLAAEAHGLQATGLGCFLDTELAAAFDLKDALPLYQVAVGVPDPDVQPHCIPPNAEYVDLMECERKTTVTADSFQALHRLALQHTFLGFADYNPTAQWTDARLEPVQVKAANDVKDVPHLSTDAITAERVAPASSVTLPVAFPSDVLMSTFAEPRTVPGGPYIPMPLITDQTVSRAMLHQLLTRGFLVIDLSPDMQRSLARARELGIDVFGQPQVHKESWTTGANLGYINIPGVREYLRLRPCDTDDTMWPHHPAGFKPEFLSLTHQFCDLSWAITRALAAAQTPQGPFIPDSLLTTLREFVPSQSGLNIIWYRAIAADHTVCSCSTHEDTGVLTFIACSDVPGLQVWDRSLSSFVPVEEIGTPGVHLFVIAGKKLSMFCADADMVKATPHRVMLPHNTSRFSTVFLQDISP